MVETSSSVSSIGSGSSGSTAWAAADRSSVPPTISRSILILKSLRVGSWRTDSAPVSSCSTSRVPPRPSFESGSVAIVNQRLKSWLRR